MNPESLKFGRGPRELTGGVDLINHYKLRAHHSFFCKKSMPSAVSETHYLHNVVGDIEIRKGEGMELDQLFQNTSYLEERTSKIRPFELIALNQAFQLRETVKVELPSTYRGAPTISGKAKDASKDKERKHKKHKDKDGNVDKEHKKHKHRNKDKDHNKGKDSKNKDKAVQQALGDHQPKRPDDKKRKHGGGEDIVNKKQTKIKIKSPKVGQRGRIRIAG